MEQTKMLLHKVSSRPNLAGASEALHRFSFLSHILPGAEPQVRHPLLPWHQTPWWLSHPKKCRHCHWYNLLGQDWLQLTKNICPASFGFLGSVTSYWRMSPWIQLDKYRYLSSIDSCNTLHFALLFNMEIGAFYLWILLTRMSVRTGGISGSAHPSTVLAGMSMTFSADQSPLSVLKKR